MPDLAQRSYTLLIFNLIVNCILNKTIATAKSTKKKRICKKIIIKTKNDKSKKNKKAKITRSTTAVDPWHLKVKEQDIRLTKIIELLSTFKKSAQFINSV